MIRLEDILIEQRHKLAKKVKVKRKSKRKQTKAYLKQIQGYLEPEQFDRFMNVYKLAGKPHMIDPNQARGLINKPLQKNIDKGNAAAAYNAFQNDIVGFKPIETGDASSTLHYATAELPHALQFRKHDNKLKNLPHAIGSLGRYVATDLIKSKLKKQDPYTTPDANYSEYHAHEQMQQQINDYIFNGPAGKELPSDISALKGQKPKDFHKSHDHDHDHNHHALAEGTIKLRDLLDD